MSKLNIAKADHIEAFCSIVLDKEKADPQHAEIIIKRNEVQIKINNKIVGRLVVTNGGFNFQYLIN